MTDSFTVQDHLCQRCLQIIDRESDGEPARVIGVVANLIMTVHQHRYPLGTAYWNGVDNCWNLPICQGCNTHFLAFCVEEEKNSDYSYWKALTKWVAPIYQRETKPMENKP